MREGWELKPLKDVCIVERGSSPRPIKSFITEDEDGVNWIKIGDTKGVEKYIYKTNQKITKKGAEKSRYVDVGDFILSNSMSFGRPYIMKTQGYIHDGWFVFRLPENIDSEFFWYLLVSPNVKEQFQGLASGAIVKNISGDLVKKTILPIPPLPEQTQIVNTLDLAFKQIDQAKANLEKNLHNAKELFQSKLNEVFSQRGEGWEEKTLKEVCEKITDGTHQTPKYFDEGVIFLSSRNVTSGKIDWDKIKYIDEEQHVAMHKRVAPKVNDILLAKNGTTGVAAMVDRDVVFDIYVSLAHIRVLDTVLPHYMLHFINSPIAKKQFNQRLKGTGVPNLHLKEIREVVIPFPTSFDKQEKIITVLNDFSEITNKAITHYQHKLNNLEELKKSILLKAFRGELEYE